MARKNNKQKRSFDPISLSFLDVISCGFGAVVLVFLILDHSNSANGSISDPQSAEINMLAEDISQGQEGLTRIRNTISDVDLEIVQAQGLAERIQSEIDSFMEELAQRENEGTARETSVERLRSEIAQLEREIERLRALDDEASGNNARQFIGEGNRQYLTGMILGGNRILILVDTSASMLDSTIVNIIRRRNMPEAQRLNAPKWLQVKRTVDWLTAQLPPPSQYQLYVFNKEARALMPGTDGSWLEVADSQQLNRQMELLNQEIPTEGTNLENLFASIKSLQPPPDNIYLITDGLPTLGSRSSNSGNISGREREQLFERAVRELPPGVPVNVIMAPLEGDPMAPSLYWDLTIKTGGSFMSPSADWP